MSDLDRINERCLEIARDCDKENWDTYGAQRVPSTAAYAASRWAQGIALIVDAFGLEEVEIEPTPDGGVRVMISRVFRGASA